MDHKILTVPIAFNEGKKIESVINRFQRNHVLEFTDLVVFDDGSTDRTADIVHSMGIKTIGHFQRKGAGAAIRSAINYAREKGYEIIVIMAGNDKDRPFEIPNLIKPIMEDGFDFVQGSRYLPGGNYGNMPFYRRIATQFIHPLLFSLVTGKRITDSTNGFRAIRLSILNDKRINLEQDWLNRYELEPYLFYKAVKLGYRVKEIPVTKIYPPKGLGYSKMKPITGWWSILRPLVYLPLRIKR